MGGWSRPKGRASRVGHGGSSGPSARSRFPPGNEVSSSWQGAEPPALGAVSLGRACRAGPGSAACTGSQALPFPSAGSGGAGTRECKTRCWGPGRKLGTSGPFTRKTQPVFSQSWMHGAPRHSEGLRIPVAGWHPSPA